MLWVQATAAQRQELLREPGELRALVDALVSVPAAAHKDGWLHRDIKPSNILHFDSRWTLADWASSRPRGQTTKVGRTGRFIGTEGFAAPELPCRRLMNRTVPRNPLSAHSTCAVANVAWPHSLARHPADPRLRPPLPPQLVGGSLLFMEPGHDLHPCRQLDYLRFVGGVCWFRRRFDQTGAMTVHCLLDRPSEIGPQVVAAAAAKNLAASPE